MGHVTELELQIMGMELALELDLQIMRVDCRHCRQLSAGFHRLHPYFERISPMTSSSCAISLPKGPFEFCHVMSREQLEKENAIGIAIAFSISHGMSTPADEM